MASNSYKTIHPVKYYRDFLSQDIRPDGRGLLKFRPAAINVGSISTADGSAVVKIGNTSVVCGIKAELATPKAEEPNCGFLVPNVELPPLCSPKFHPGPPSDEAQICSNFIAEVISSSECVNRQELCIAAEHLAWVLRCDLICLDHDGAVLDACVTALIAALKTVNLPAVQYDADTEDIVVSPEVKHPLKVHSMPVAATYAVFEDEILLADPTNEEECLASTTLTIVSQDDQLCSVHKPGGSPISSTELQECIDRALIRAKYINTLVHTALKSR